MILKKQTTPKISPENSGNKDLRYTTIRVLIEAGHIKSILDIFVFIPKTIVYKELGANFNRFDKAIFDPSLFRMGELLMLAEMFNIDGKRLLDMAYEQILTTKKRKSKTN